MFKKVMALVGSLMILAGCGSRGPIVKEEVPVLAESKEMVLVGTGEDKAPAPAKEEAPNKTKASKAEKVDRPKSEVPVYDESNTATEVWYGDIEHIFFHPLIVFPELAFDGSYREKGFDDWMITRDELIKIIDNLYARDYMLIRAEDAFKEVNGRWQRNPELRFPKGKKPLILTIDDLSYNEVYQGRGFADKLVLDEKGRVTAQYTEAGKVKTSRDYEVATYVNKFVEEHPDFAWKGARGILALTGYEGVLGYRTQEGAPNRALEVEKAKEIARVLKKDGWEFSNHSYGHFSLPNHPLKKLRADTAAWQKEVVPIVGKTHIYTLPYGNLPHEIKEKKKIDHLVDNGYHIIFAVGIEPYIAPNKKSPSRVIQDRRAIDGHSMRKSGKLDDLFPVKDVFSKSRKANPVGHDNEV